MPSSKSGILAAIDRYVQQCIRIRSQTEKVDLTLSEIADLVRREPIFRQGFRHLCWVPRPADSISHIRDLLGIPTDSIGSDLL